MFDADTSRVIISRDVNFINKMFYRSDLSRTALVAHPNDIILNRKHLPQTPQLGGNKEQTMEELEIDTDDEGDPAEDNDSNDLSVSIPVTRENEERRRAVRDELRRFTENNVTPMQRRLTRSPRARLVAGAGSAVPNHNHRLQLQQKGWR